MKIFYVVNAMIFGLSRAHAYTGDHFFQKSADGVHRVIQNRQMKALRKIFEMKNMSSSMRENFHKSKPFSKITRTDVERNLKDLKTATVNTSSRLENLSKKHMLSKRTMKKRSGLRKYSQNLRVHSKRKNSKLSRKLKSSLQRYYTDVSRRRLIAMPLMPHDVTVSPAQAPGVVNSRFVMNSIGTPASSWYQGGVAPMGYGRPDDNERVVITRLQLPGNMPTGFV